VSAQGFVPLHDRIVIEPTDAFRSGGVLELPQAYDDDVSGSNGDLIRERNKLCLGIVRAIGSGERDEDGEIVRPDVEVGERVMYDRASAVEIVGTDPKLVVVREAGIAFAVGDDVEPVLGGLVTARGG
jgi:co-chaperonin GroES (HSP10)